MSHRNGNLENTDELYFGYNSSVFSRFPKYNNEILFLRRIPTPEPGDLNRENWDASRQS